MLKILKYLKLFGWIILCIVVFSLVTSIGFVFYGTKHFFRHLGQFIGDTCRDIWEELEMLLDGAKYTTTQMWKDEQYRQ